MRGSIRAERDIDRFEEKYIPVPESGCWIWIAGSYLKGLPYGKFRLLGKTMPAHRASWMLHNGSISEGLFVCHKCDNPYCVNPAHLFTGTPLDNMRDKIEKHRHKGAKKGEMHHFAKLTISQVAQIRDDRSTQREIADRYSISQSTVSSIKNRRKWKCAE